MNHRVITLKKQLHYETNPKDKIDCLIELSDAIQYIDLKEAEGYSRQAMILSQQIGYNEGLYISKISLGHIEINLQRYKEAITLFKSALNYYDKFEELASEKKKATIYNGLGKAYSELRNYQKAFEYLNEAYSIYRKSNDEINQAKLLNDIGLFLKRNNKLRDAHGYFQKANLLISNSTDMRISPIVLLNLGASLNSLERYDEAEPVLRKSYDLSTRQNYILNKSLCLSEIGVIHKARKKFEDAIECFKLSNLQIMKTVHRETIAKNYQLMGMVYFEEAKTENAVTCFHESINTARAYNHHELIPTSYKYLSELYKKLGDFESAFEYYELYHNSEITNLLKKNEELERVRFIENQIQQLRQQNEIYAIRNIELKKKNEMLRILSTTDELTGVYNRRYVIEMLGEITRNIRNGACERYFLLMIDIDDFKYINDTFGHATGDFVLRSICECIKKSAGEDATLARYGGDEFLVIFDSVEIETVKEKGKKIKEMVSEILKEKNYVVSFSGGVAVIDKDNTIVDEILTNADNLLYTAKENSKKHICYQ